MVLLAARMTFNTCLFQRKQKDVFFRNFKKDLCAEMYVCLCVQRELMKYVQDHFCITVDHQSNTSSSICEIIHRDQLIDLELVYSQYKRIQENAYKRHNGQHESIKSCIDELKVKGYSAYM